MQLQQLVERATEGGAHDVVILAGGEHLVQFLGPLAGSVVARSDAKDPVLWISAIGVSGVEDGVTSAAEALGQRDVLVLAMRSAPDCLPVGPLVEALVNCGLWVVEVAPAPARGVGCALVVTRDESAPWRSYLLGDTISHTDNSVLRLLAERAVEGLAERAQVATLKQRDRELTRELETLRASIRDRGVEFERVTDELRRMKEDELRRMKEKERGPQHGGLIVQAARLVRREPVRGTGRVFRSVLWRARHKGRARAVSEIDDGSV